MVINPKLDLYYRSMQQSQSEDIGFMSSHPETSIADQEIRRLQAQIASQEQRLLEQSAQYAAALNHVQGVHQHEMDSRHATPAPNPEPRAEPTNSSTQRILPPAMFEGKRDAKNTPANWIFQARAYVKIMTGRIPADDITYQLSVRLTGAASAWLRTQVTIHRVSFVGPDSLLDALEAYMVPPRINRDARDLLVTLRQTGTALDYTDQFTEICQQISDISDAERFYTYIRGLKSHIRYQVDASDVTTLEAAINRAIAADRLQGNPSRPDEKTRWKAPSANTRHPIAMDLSAFTASVGSRPFQRLTDAQRAFLGANRGCFYCRKPNAGHQSRECPERSEQPENVASVDVSAIEQSEDGRYAKSNLVVENVNPSATWEMSNNKTLNSPFNPLLLY